MLSFPSLDNMISSTLIIYLPFPKEKWLLTGRDSTATGYKICTRCFNCGNILKFSFDLEWEHES